MNLNTKMRFHLLIIHLLILTYFIGFCSEILAYRSPYASQTFIENANQFNEKQGIRSDQTMQTNSSRDVIPEYSGIEVERSEPKPKTSTSSRSGFSFSDMAKNLQKQPKVKQVYSFKNMATSTQKIKIPTSNLLMTQSTLNRLIRSTRSDPLN
jgi:hypothetical protein